MKIKEKDEKFIFKEFIKQLLTVRWFIPIEFATSLIVRDASIARSIE